MRLRLSAAIGALALLGTSTPLQMRRRQAPKITRRCLPPGATTPKTCT